MDIIKSNEITEGLNKAGRAYLCGNLQKPSSVDHIPTSAYEIGISDFPTYNFEHAHVHTDNEEYSYVLEGTIKVLLLNEKKEYAFHKGDFFVIHANEPYVTKELAGTRTIFSKVPGGNDKKLVPMSEAILRWGSSWENRYEEA